jgi:hypothetical protein
MREAVQSIGKPYGQQGKKCNLPIQRIGISPERKPIHAACHEGHPWRKEALSLKQSRVRRDRLEPAP